ncbi:hypothetical protein DAPPUDRAFT_249723 [Daphnia pulex]|uniref:Zinc finger PHD-type domain-containing protein n=1 Tax=Daphnia pulex TaxID=6669 RepID=E9GX63_DAPPU|nr:hypothetical protein DAPPUDRAFT_249723 [Daphnia pulex]|eukprot:EFX75819.1 hypothetical protein DAPPUDRAFT_249723 [Daphnia pulex]
MTIYDIPGILNKAFPLASTPSNITAGFKKAGIVPFDREGFHATADYNPGFVTDRPEPDPENVAVTLEMDLPPENQPFDVPPYFFVDVELTVEPIAEPTVLEPAVEPTVELNEEPSVEPTVQANSPKRRSGSSPKANNSPTPSSISSASSSSSTASIIEELRPFPKAGPRTAPKANNGRRKRTSAVLTDTPIKDVIESEKAAVRTKAARKIFASKEPNKTKAIKPKQTRRKKEKGESFCPECAGRYSTTKEDWIRCLNNCGLWACESCVDDRGEDDESYICSNCSKAVL